jgi:hypothetical protein
MFSWSACDILINRSLYLLNSWSVVKVTRFGVSRRVYRTSFS